LLGLQATAQDQARGWIVDQLSFIDRYGVSTARADDAAFFLQEAFRTRGFVSATVDWRVPDGASDRIVLTVDEGVRLTLGTVTVDGNTPEVMPDEAVVELLTADTRERLGLSSSDPVPFVRADLESGLVSIREYYGLLSYLDAEVDLGEASPDPRRGGSVPVSLGVREGKPHRVGAVDTGPPPEPDLTAEFEAAREEFEGAKLTTGTAGLLRQAIDNATRSAGYFDRQITVDVLPARDEGETKVADLTVVADFGPKYSVRDVTVDGNVQVLDLVFEKLFEGLVGQPFDPDEFGDQVRRMLATGAFRKVASEPEPHEDDTLTLALKVEEAPSRRVGVFGGYGSYDGPIIGLELSDLILFGRVQRIDLRGEFSSRGLRGDVRFTDPWFRWSDWSLTANAFGRSREDEGYDLWEAGLALELRREFGERQALSVLASGGYADTTPAGIDPEFLGPQHYLTRSVGLAYEFVQWGRTSTERKGLEARLSADLGSTSSGGDDRFFRTSGKLAYHLPLGPAELGLAARAGFISPLGDGEIPIDLRFFNGGGRSVRSFRERDLGPRNRGFPVGGEFFTAFNAELTAPVWGGVRGAAFADAGNLLPDAGDAGLDDLHYAAGLGLRYDLPIGPLRVDYGLNLNRGENEPSGTWHITFGFAF
jgi:outer membrane protein assembly complex protein YaeT